MIDDSRHSMTPPSHGDRMPLSTRVWLLMSPFAIFRNASRGDRYARAAAYRYNRQLRVYLPGYLLRWSVSAVLVLVLMAATESLAGWLQPASTLLMLLAGAFGIAFTASVGVLFVTAYAYLYLSHVEGTDGDARRAVATSTARQRSRSSAD